MGMEHALRSEPWLKHPAAKTLSGGKRMAENGVPAPVTSTIEKRYAT